MEAIKPFQFITKDKVTYLVFKPWESNTLTHCFTTRLGGVSKGHLESLNLGFNRGDEEKNVVENYKRVCKALELPFESLVLSKQVHETHIAKVTKADQGNGIIYPSKWESKDGMYTKDKGVTLVTHYADCVPLFFYAPKYGMIGMAHAGWRGTVGGIGKAMVDIWVHKEGVLPEEIQVVIGPSIGPCCFEVGEEVAKVFKARFKDAKFITPLPNKEKYSIDLWACNKAILCEAGVLEEHIFIAQMCTCCHFDIFFSHRRTQGKRGTLAGFMCLKEEDIDTKEKAYE